MDKTACVCVEKHTVSTQRERERERELNTHRNSKVYLFMAELDT